MAGRVAGVHELKRRERPIIGVTGPDAGGGAAWWFTRLAVWIAGGRAVRITPKRPRRIDGLDGLVVGGGADVDPGLYGQYGWSVPRDHTRLVLPTRHAAALDKRPQQPFVESHH